MKTFHILISLFQAGIVQRGNFVLELRMLALNQFVDDLKVSGQFFEVEVFLADEYLLDAVEVEDGCVNSVSLLLDFLLQPLFL